MYSPNFCREVNEKDRTYYEVYSLPRTEQNFEDYKEVSFVCIRPDSVYEALNTVRLMYRKASRKVAGLGGTSFSSTPTHIHKKSAI